MDPNQQPNAQAQGPTPIIIQPTPASVPEPTQNPAPNTSDFNQPPPVPVSAMPAFMQEPDPATLPGAPVPDPLPLQGVAKHRPWVKPVVIISIAFGLLIVAGFIILVIIAAATGLQDPTGN